MCFNKTNLRVIEPIRNIEIPYSAAGKSDAENNVAAHTSNAGSAEENEASTQKIQAHWKSQLVEKKPHLK